MAIASQIQRLFNPLNFFELPKEYEYIHYIKYDYNVFDLKQTKRIWNSKNNLAKKVLFSMIAAIHEFIYHKCFKLVIYNYHASLENRKINQKNKNIFALNEQIRNLRNSKLFLAKHYSLGIAKLAGFMLASALVSYTLGSAILISENYVSKIAVLNMNFPTIIRLVSKGGRSLQNIGKYMVLSVSAPSYFFFNFLPKYLFSTTPATVDQAKVSIEENPLMDAVSKVEPVIEGIALNILGEFKPKMSTVDLYNSKSHETVKSKIIVIEMPFSEIERFWK